MALSYGFFDAELTPSGQYDRVYAAEHFAEYFHLIVSNGVFPDPATQLQVVASDTPNMNVNVSDGYGWINGYYAKNSGPYPLAIQAASGTLNRIDAVVLRWVNDSRSMELAVKTGIAASSPATPALQRDTDVYELMLATVTVAAGATNIPQSSITDKRSDTAVCGWVTGAVQNIDTTNLFAQYDTAFQEWFDNIKSQLSGDVATNLQNQIDRNAAGIATINATTLKADTKTALGLPASAGPDDAFKVLANIGNLHMWERVQTYAEPVPEVPAGYTLGPVETDVVQYSGMYGSFSIWWNSSSSVTVSNDGTISLVSPNEQNATFSDLGKTLNKSIFSGKYIYITSSVRPAVDGVFFVPSDAKITVTTNYDLIFSKLQRVTGYPYTPAIPAGTTTDYLTSTDRNAYPDESTDGSDAYYTLGAAGYLNFYYSENDGAVTWKYSSSISVDADGTVSLVSPSRTEMMADNTGVSSANNLKGKFVLLSAKSNYTDATHGVIYYIPADATISSQVSSTTPWYIQTNKAQPVTGHAAIPANTTITYLGQLGGGARIEVGSYVGTGTYGSGNPNSLTFGFEPKMVIISASLISINNYTKGNFPWHRGDGFGQIGFSSGTLGDSSKNCVLVWEGNTLSWYHNYSATSQMNNSGSVYTYTAIG